MDGSRLELILASSSPRRQELLRFMGLPFTVVPSQADETVPPDTAPEHAVALLSRRKAELVAARLKRKTPGIVIGSDTIVVLDGAMMGKPADEAEARRMLSSLQGRTHIVYSGLACLAAGWEDRPGTGRGVETEAVVSLGDKGEYWLAAAAQGGRPAAIVGYTASRVTFRPMSRDEIDCYIATGEPMDKAGGYGVQGIGSVFIEQIEGDFYSVMGLPLNLLYPMLLKFGVSPFKAMTF